MKPFPKNNQKPNFFSVELFIVKMEFEISKYLPQYFYCIKIFGTAVLRPVFNSSPVHCSATWTWTRCTLKESVVGTSCNSSSSTPRPSPSPTRLLLVGLGLGLRVLGAQSAKYTSPCCDTYTIVLNNSVNAGDQEGSYQVQALRESLFVWGVWFGVAIANALASPNPHLLKQIFSSCCLPLSASGSLVGEDA